MTPSDILGFWFEGDPSLRRAKWFEKDAAFDAVCSTFTAAIRDARSGCHDHWATQPMGGLALIVLLDQLSRNVFRGTPEAFAADAHARQIARGMIASGFDTPLTPMQRMFVYLPFEHSEALDDQETSVRLFDTLRNHMAIRTVDYARAHRDVILRFGRFPHRNAVLGRPSTPAEEAYLAQPGAGF